MQKHAFISNGLRNTLTKSYFLITFADLHMLDLLNEGHLIFDSYYLIN